jgi:hypothetical protein
MLQANSMTVDPEACGVQHGTGGCPGRSFISASASQRGKSSGFKLV